MASSKQLDAELRQRVGKGAARATRRDSRVPAVIYGGGQAPVSISLDYNRTNQLIYAGHFLTTVFEIKVGSETIRAIPRDYQLHPVKDTPVHVDFLRLSAGATIRVEVPVHFINHEASPGLKQGGSLNIVRHAVELVVPAENIPDSLTADLTGLAFNDAVKISAIKLPENTRTVIQGRDFTIATITPPKAAEEEKPAAAAEAAPAAAAAPAAEKK
ncbi:MAG: 50S ribosomal protein L25/general stress protein Ctc [Beijerinckiaceae bacterium]